VSKLNLPLAFIITLALSFGIIFGAMGFGITFGAMDIVAPALPANSDGTAVPPAQRRSVSQPEKYRPRLTSEQMAHPSTFLQQHELALSAYDSDLVNIARARFHYMNDQLDWLDKAQQQREANNIDWTKPLTYPVQMGSYPAPMNSVTVGEENEHSSASASNNAPRLVTNAPGVRGFVTAR
jgi:hypothetical protein